MRLRVLRLSPDGRERASALMIVEQIDRHLSRTQSKQGSGSSEVSRENSDCYFAWRVEHYRYACDAAYADNLVAHLNISFKQHESTLHCIYSHAE